jgi:putative ABC transport system permease protein
VLAALLFGAGPALRYSRFRSQGLNDRTASGTVGRTTRRRTQALLVGLQITIAVTLLVGAGLLVRSFARLTSVHSGYDAANVLTFQLAMPQRPVPELSRFSAELVASLARLPGIDAAAYARQLPTVQIQEGASFRRTAGVPLETGPPGADARLVGGSYFETLGIRLTAGRGLTDRDGAGQPRVVVINQTLARRDFAGEQPIGQQVYIGRDSLPWQIVGIADDVRQFGPERPPDPQFFADIRQWPVANEVFIGFLGPYYAVRTRTDWRAAAAAIEQVVRRMQPDASLHNVAPLEQLAANSLAQPRLYTVLLALFAAIAAALAATGVYGVVTYAVAQRTREIGIRLALGATRSQVMRLVLQHTMFVSAAGILAGVAGASAVTRYLQGMLFGIEPLDASTFMTVALLFAALAAVAAYVPARRATTVLPLLALRGD